MHLFLLVLHKTLVVRYLFLDVTGMLESSNSTCSALLSKKQIFFIVTTFMDHLANSCWTDSLGHALQDLNIFNYLTFDMFNWEQDYNQIYSSLTKYYEWVCNQVRQTTMLYYSSAELTLMILSRNLIITCHKHPSCTPLPSKIWIFGCLVPYYTSHFLTTAYSSLYPL